VGCHIYYNDELVCRGQRIDGGGLQQHRAEGTRTHEIVLVLGLLPEKPSARPHHAPAGTGPDRQRLAFKLKEEKSGSWDKQENGRLIHMFFIDLESEHEVDQSFFDLKAQLQ
jgi:hypothetical protein